MRLKDKVIIITGGGQGLGREFALRLSQEGAKIVLAEINVEKALQVAREIERDGREVLEFETDVTSEMSTQEMAQKAVEKFGKIDVLINNAAALISLSVSHGTQIKPFHEITEEEWDKMMAVNVKGLWLCTKAVFPQMRDQGKGKIINMSSAVFNLGSPFMLHYVTSKGAVVGMTRALAKELVDFGINVNCISPGRIWTEASEKLKESMPRGFLENVDNIQVSKRREQPSDLMGAVIYFASDESDFVTGQNLIVDGGIAMQ